MATKPKPVASPVQAAPAPLPPRVMQQGAPMAMPAPVTPRPTTVATGTGTGQNLTGATTQGGITYGSFNAKPPSQATLPAPPTPAGVRPQGFGADFQEWYRNNYGPRNRETEWTYQGKNRTAAIVPKTAAAPTPAPTPAPPKPATNPNAGTMTSNVSANSGNLIAQPKPVDVVRPYANPTITGAPVYGQQATSVLDTGLPDRFFYR